MSKVGPIAMGFDPQTQNELYSNTGECYKHVNSVCITYIVTYLAHNNNNNLHIYTYIYYTCIHLMYSNALKSSGN